MTIARIFGFDDAALTMSETSWDDIFGYLVGSGVFGGYLNECQVVASSPAAMTVEVKTGRFNINGSFGHVTVQHVLTVTAADPTNPRIDRVVLRRSNSADTITAAVLAGTPAASPSAPALTQTTGTYEISLAQVYVAAAATTIITGNITDERNTSNCGWIVGSKGVLTDLTQTLTNKTLTTPTIASFVNATHDHADAAGGGNSLPSVTPSTTLAFKDGGTYAFTLKKAGDTGARNITFPDATDTVVMLTQSQTLTNKTLTTPVIASFTNAQHDHSSAGQGGAPLPQTLTVSGTGGLKFKDGGTFAFTFKKAADTADRNITIPNATDTLVMLTQAQTLTNKTLTTPTIGDFTNATHTHTNAAGGGNALTPGSVSVTGLSGLSFKDGGTNAFTLKKAGDTGARNITFPDATDTVVMLTQSQTLTNKTLTAPTLGGTTTAGIINASTLNIAGATLDSGGNFTTSGYVQATGTIESSSDVGITIYALLSRGGSSGGEVQLRTRGGNATTNDANTGVIYVKAGALWYIGTSGTATKIADA